MIYLPHYVFVSNLSLSEQKSLWGHEDMGGYKEWYKEWCVAPVEIYSRKIIRSIGKKKNFEFLSLFSNEQVAKMFNLNSNTTPTTCVCIRKAPSEWRELIFLLVKIHSKGIKVDYKGDARPFFVLKENLELDKLL